MCHPFLINKLVTYVLRNRNQLPVKDGISDRISPLGIVLGYPLPNYNCLKLYFDTYVQAYDNPKRTNTTDTRSVGAIALSMTPSASGAYDFMSPQTGRIIHRKHFTVLPITEALITQVGNLAAAENQPLIVENCPLLEWRPGVPIADDILVDPRSEINADVEPPDPSDPTNKMPNHNEQ